MAKLLGLADLYKDSLGLMKCPIHMASSHWPASYPGLSTIAASAAAGTCFTLQYFHIGPIVPPVNVTLVGSKAPHTAGIEWSMYTPLPPTSCSHTHFSWVPPQIRFCWYNKFIFVVLACNTPHFNGAPRITNIKFASFQRHARHSL